MLVITLKKNGKEKKFCNKIVGKALYLYLYANVLSMLNFLLLILERHMCPISHLLCFSLYESLRYSFYSIIYFYFYQLGNISTIFCLSFFFTLKKNGDKIEKLLCCVARMLKNGTAYLLMPYALISFRECFSFLQNM